MENLFNQFRTLVALPENVKTLSISEQQAILNRHEPFFRLRFVEQPKGTKASEWFEREFPAVVQDYADSIEAKAAICRADLAESVQRNFADVAGRSPCGV